MSGVVCSAVSPAEVIEAWRHGSSMGYVSKKASARSLTAFGAACLTASPAQRVKGSVMYARYIDWCRSVGGVLAMCPQRLFTLEMTRYGMLRDLSYPTWWVGVALLDEPRELAAGLLDGVRYVSPEEASERVRVATAALRAKQEEERETIARENAKEMVKHKVVKKRNSEMDTAVFGWAYGALHVELGYLLDMRVAHAHYVKACQADEEQFYGIAEFVEAMKIAGDYKIQGKGTTAHCLGFNLSSDD